MATTPVGVENFGAGEDGGQGQFVRVIVADTQAIFRAGLRKIFALEDDIRVVGQAETLAQTQSAVARFSADVLIFESALAPNPVEWLNELLRQNPKLKVVVVTPGPDEELTLELFRRGAHGVVSREVEPELMVDCLRKVVAGECWLDAQGIRWVLEAYRNQNSRTSGSRPKVQLTPKESLIVSCVTQGMKNKEIALRVGTTEQVVKNYLRKVYDKLGVADRLELALFCLNNRVIDGEGKAGEARNASAPAVGPAASASATPSSQPVNGTGQVVDKASAAIAGSGNCS